MIKEEREKIIRGMERKLGYLADTLFAAEQKKETKTKNYAQHFEEFKASLERYEKTCRRHTELLHLEGSDLP